MTFEKLLKIHEGNLAWIKRQMAAADTEIEKSRWQGAIAMESVWFGRLKQECDDYDPAQWTESATEEDKASFSFDGAKPEMMLAYRGHRFPMYSDDYGQCYFTRVNGAVWSGGAYNLMPEYDFCDFADKFIDEELLK